MLENIAFLAIILISVLGGGLFIATVQVIGMFFNIDCLDRFGRFFNI